MSDTLNILRTVHKHQTVTHLHTLAAPGIFVALLAITILCLGRTGLNAQGANSDKEQIPLPISRAEAFLLNVPIDLKQGEKAFQSCSACHGLGENVTSDVGPKLDGIVGRIAGSIDGYQYSKAMRKAFEAGLVWNAYRLDAYIAAPGRFMEGNKMAFIGLDDETQRRNLIAYLKTFP